MSGLTANSMFDPLGSGNTLSIQESPPNTHSISSQTKRFDNIRAPIDTSVDIYFEWFRCLLGSIVLWSQSFWIRN